MHADDSNNLLVVTRVQPQASHETSATTSARPSSSVSSTNDGEKVLLHTLEEIVLAGTAKDLVRAKAEARKSLRTATLTSTTLTTSHADHVSNLHRHGKHEFDVLDITAAWLVILGVVVTTAVIRLGFGRLWKALWPVTSSSVVVLQAALLFVSFRGCLDFFMSGERPFWEKTLPAFGFFLFLFLLLQVSMLFGTNPGSDDRTEPEEYLSTKLQRSFVLQGPGDDSQGFQSILLAYMCGFASVDAGVALLDEEFFRDSVLKAAAAVLANQVLVAMLDGLSSLLLRRRRMTARLQALKDVVVSMPMAFLLVHLLSFLVSGQMQEHAWEQHWEHHGEVIPTEVSEAAAVALPSVGVLAAGAALVLSSHERRESIILRRLMSLCQRISSFLMAWCFLWVICKLARRLGLLVPLGEEGSLVRELILDLGISALALVVAFLLDRAEVVASRNARPASTALLPSTVPVSWSSGRAALSAGLGLLLGVTWQACLSKAAVVAASVIPQSELAELGLMLLVALLVLWAWCWPQSATSNQGEDREGYAVIGLTSPESTPHAEATTASPAQSRERTAGTFDPSALHVAKPTRPFVPQGQRLYRQTGPGAALLPPALLPAGGAKLGDPGDLAQPGPRCAFEEPGMSVVLPMD